MSSKAYCLARPNLVLKRWIWINNDLNILTKFPSRIIGHCPSPVVLSALIYYILNLYNSNGAISNGHRPISDVWIFPYCVIYHSMLSVWDRITIIPNHALLIGFSLSTIIFAIVLTRFIVAILADALICCKGFCHFFCWLLISLQYKRNTILYISIKTENKI